MKKYNVLRLVFLFSISLLPAVWSTVWSQALGEMVPDWSSVEHGPFHLVTPTDITNPVLTADDVTDVEAEFVADPFMFHENGTWYIFFDSFRKFRIYPIRIYSYSVYLSHVKINVF